ncbi:hypothetical protein SDC9_136553 [bioreactor metagenome]|uniref:Uncharacterized protein n=1 Tax=bioreactor metagenome TaxID=1076179 RepID=A0A645DIZ6_9ZZZZ
MTVIKILVAAKKVLQEGYMLTELGALPKGLRRIPVTRPAALIPGLWLQRINHIMAAHEINKAAAKVFGEFDVFVLWIEANHAFP